jgi:hypothetical protein
VGRVIQSGKDRVSTIFRTPSSENTTSCLIRSFFGFLGRRRLPANLTVLIVLRKIADHSGFVGGLLDPDLRAALPALIA